MRLGHHHFVRAGFALAAILAFWLLTTGPAGLGVFQLIVFVAPGALLGLATGWMANASTQDRWTWAAGRRAAVRGALILPPILAALVALDGNDRPSRLLDGFVRAAWLALAVGVVVALARLLRDRP